MHNNQQTRFITLMHDDRVQIQGDFIEDPARALRITVLNDSVQARPLVCRVRVEWAQTIVDDPAGAFDLNVEPWDSNWQSPDIWVDRDPFGSFDNPTDAQGRPGGNGDKPWVNHINQFTARVHVSGAMGTSNVKVTFYAITPPGVGDNGNWLSIAVKTIANIPQSGVHGYVLQLGTGSGQTHMPAKLLRHSNWERFRAVTTARRKTYLIFKRGEQPCRSALHQDGGS